MLNQCALVGKIKELPKEVKDSSGYGRMMMKIVVERPFPSVNNETGSDLFDVELWRGASDSTSALCKLDDVIGLRGRLESVKFINDENKEIIKTIVIAEKITFIEARILNAHKNKDKQVS